MRRTLRNPRAHQGRTAGSGASDLPVLRAHVSDGAGLYNLRWRLLRLPTWPKSLYIPNVILRYVSYIVHGILAVGIVLLLMMLTAGCSSSTNQGVRPGRGIRALQTYSDPSNLFSLEKPASWTVYGR